MGRMGFSVKAWCALALLMGWPGAVPASAQSDAVPRFEPVECWFAVPPGAVTCGYLVVPEDHAQPDGKTIRLAVAVLKSRSPSPAPDPLIFLQGGPGGSMVGAAPSALDTFGCFLGSRDVVLLDQRGTGLSEPNLSCPEVSAVFYKLLADPDLDPDAQTALTTEAAVRCRDRLTAEGVNLAAYTSAQNAADVAALRVALGYDEWNLMGVSYGTRLALTVMRDHPEGIRSVILDSTYPPQVNGYLDLLPNTERVFNTLFDGCATDLACNLTYPNLKAVYFEVFDRLETAPVFLEAVHPTTGKKYTLRIDGMALTNGIFALLYDSFAIRYLPALIYDVRDGDYRRLEQFAWQPLLTFESISIGMFLSVQCGEEAPFTTRDAILAAAQAYPEAFRGRGIFSESDFAACAIWPRAKVNPVENAPVTGDIPTLVLAGEYDPITPPAWGRQAAEYLSHSYFYEFPGTGHGVFGTANCPVGITLSFLSDPGKAPDASCIAAMRGPTFVLTERAARPLGYLLVVVLSGVAAWAGWRGGTALLVKHAYRSAWHISLKMMGWAPAAITTGVLALVFLVAVTSKGIEEIMPQLTLLHAASTVVPVAMGVMAAYLFSPEEEPPLEVMLAAPRPIAWALLERLGVMFAVLAVPGMLGTAATPLLGGTEDMWAVAVRWVPAAVFFTGVGAFITLTSRQATFGVAMTLLTWFGMAFIGDALLPGRPVAWPISVLQPFFWLLHAYLQPGELSAADYALNRVVVALVGVGLILMAARQLRDPERVLVGKKSRPARES